MFNPATLGSFFLHTLYIFRMALWTDFCNGYGEAVHRPDAHGLFCFGTPNDMQKTVKIGINPIETFWPAYANTKLNIVNRSHRASSTGAWVRWAHVDLLSHLTIPKLLLSQLTPWNAFIIITQQSNLHFAGIDKYHNFNTYGLFECRWLQHAKTADANRQDISTSSLGC